MSNRQTIINALTKATVATAEELADETRWPERKVRDTLSDLKKLGLITAERDDVTGKAAYRLADPKTDKPVSATAAPAVAAKSVVRENRTTESKTDILADDIKTAQREIDAEVRLDSAGRTIIDFCEWLAGKAKVRCPMNLHECKTVVTDAMRASELVADLKSKMEAVVVERNVAESALIKNNNLLHAAIGDLARINEALELDPEDGGAQPIIDAFREISATLDEASAEIARLDAENHALKILNESMPGFGATFAALKQSDLPAGVTLKTPQPNSNRARYIVADSYVIAGCIERANECALELAKNNEIDSPVVVFETHAARELRINWSDI